MKKLVVINFDDQYINTSEIIYNILTREIKKIDKEASKELSLDDIVVELEKPLNLLVNNICDEVGIPYIQDYSKIYKEFEKKIINESVLSNGLQNFLLECKKKKIEVVIISNKPYESIKKCVKRFTPYIKNILHYDYPVDADKLIENLLKERNLQYSDVLIVSSSDFNNEYLKIYEYSLMYCGDNVFSSYGELLDVLYDKEISFPRLEVSFDIEVEKKNAKKVLDLLNKNFLDIEVLTTYDKKRKIIVPSLIVKECKQEDESSMYLDKVIDECLDLFYSNEELLNVLNNDLGCKLYLSIVVYFESSKINPSISTSKKIIEFLSKNKIELNYSVYC